MSSEPLAGLTHQRYFFVALMQARPRQDFDAAWLWQNLSAKSRLRGGRIEDRRFSGRASVEFRTLLDSPSYAGSVGNRTALETRGSGSECAYDIFVASTSKNVFAVGTGYSTLTGSLVGRLRKKGLVSRAVFLKPKLAEIVDLARGGDDDKRRVKIAPTGFNALIPGIKDISGLRLTGANVFRSELVAKIEEWFRSSADTAEKDGLFDYQRVRLRFLGRLSGSAASITFASDGMKLWLGKLGRNLGEFVDGVELLCSLGLFEESVDAPSWSEDAAL